MVRKSHPTVVVYCPRPGRAVSRKKQLKWRNESEDRKSEDGQVLWHGLRGRDGSLIWDGWVLFELNSCSDHHYFWYIQYILQSLNATFTLFLPHCFASSGKKVTVRRLVFVAPFPNAMIKKNNIDNNVPSEKQWAEIPTSASQRDGVGVLAVWLPAGRSRRSCSTHSNQQQFDSQKQKRPEKITNVRHKWSDFKSNSTWNWLFINRHELLDTCVRVTSAVL